MAKRRKRSGAHPTQEERVERFKNALDKMLDGATIASAAESESFSERSFYDWLGKYSDFAELYKKHRKEENARYKGRIRKKAKSLLERRLEGQQITEIKKEGVQKKGQIAYSKVTELKKTVYASATEVIFALKITDPELREEDFNDKNGLNVDLGETKTIKIDFTS